MNKDIAAEVIACIAEGRDPTVGELFDVAERIWRDVSGERNAFSWSALERDRPERLFCLQAAHAALRGTD